jgi:hypothetical protein
MDHHGALSRDRRIRGALPVRSDARAAPGECDSAEGLTYLSTYSIDLFMAVVVNSFLLVLNSRRCLLVLKRWAPPVYS